MSSDQPINDDYVAVVGWPGAGKSAFIAACTGKHEQESHSANDFPDTSFNYNDFTRVHLVEIASSSDDTDHDANTDSPKRLTAQQAVDAFASQGISCSGVIFVHPISNELGASNDLGLKNLELFKMLCGAEAGARSSAVLATTMWSKVTLEEGEQREMELVGPDGAFHHLHEAGSKGFRFENTKESALEILSSLLSQWGIQPSPMTLDTQADTVDTDIEDTQITDTDTTPADTTDADSMSTDTTRPDTTDADSMTIDTPQHIAIEESSQADMDDARQLDIEIVLARQKNTARLAEMYTQIEQAMHEHDQHLEILFRGEIATLETRLQESEAEHQRLQTLLQAVTSTKDSEITALRTSIQDTNERHELALAQHTKAAQEELVQHTKSTQEELSRRDDEHRSILAAVRADLTLESDNRVKSLLEDLTRESDARVKAVRAEMQAEFERERQQNMRAVKAELARMADREQEARERAKRAEMAAARRSDSPSSRGQPLQSWAVARLWGVGSQTRSR
ncbi:hypothetical protein B0H63DRAFT_190647 [Podospora didyma]|uniref:G domain-containing protein n=1 Tax=Podospora didyma TaxID=330526 RepID=A0AAE0U072_9PEZI|nr:hypothetical protein B0H63DRAFT_190647 [Podospora didyma]